VCATAQRRPRSSGRWQEHRTLRAPPTCAASCAAVRVTLSKLEARFLALLREHGLPLPATNTKAGTHRVDCRWPDHRLTVELDSYCYHNSRHAWEQDRQRERQAHARGDQHRRYTHHDVTRQPAQMLTELHALLAPG
jgi:very-short-patch-repair endonuclease